MLCEGGMELGEERDGLASDGVRLSVYSSAMVEVLGLGEEDDDMSQR